MIDSFLCVKEQSDVTRIYLTNRVFTFFLWVYVFDLRLGSAQNQLFNLYRCARQDFWPCCEAFDDFWWDDHLVLE